MNKSPCHVKRGPLCINAKVDDVSTDFYKAYVAYTRLTQDANYYNNTECVRKIYNSLYWTALDKIKEAEGEDDKFGLYLFLGIAIGAVFIIAILLLVIYFKRRKSDEDESEGITPDKLTTP